MRPKDIGTAAESAVVKYLRENGFGNAERRALRGGNDCGDITGCGPIVIEVKAGKAAEGASDGLVQAWLAEAETERRNARADVAVLVMKRKGKSGNSAGDWWAVQRNGFGFPERMLFRHFVHIQRYRGYGDAL